MPDTETTTAVGLYLAKSGKHHAGRGAHLLCNGRPTAQLSTVADETTATEALEDVDCPVCHRRLELLIRRNKRPDPDDD